MRNLEGLLHNILERTFASYVAQVVQPGKEKV